MSVEPDLTDGEKIAWLWGKVDGLHSENASLKAAVAVAEATSAERVTEVERLRGQLEALGRDLAEMARQLNEARQAAATAVRDYMAEVG